MTDGKISVILDAQDANALIACYWSRIAVLSETERNFPSQSMQYTLDQIGKARQILDSIESLCNAIRSRTNDRPGISPD